MLDEITDLFGEVPAGVVVDATLGGGGHSASLLASRPDLEVLGIDQDADALAAAADRLSEFGERLIMSHRRFDELDQALEDNDIDNVSGVLFDLGVSSPQLDRGQCGFSYRNEGPLDMRMDADQQWSAVDVVNDRITWRRLPPIALRIATSPVCSATIVVMVLEMSTMAEMSARMAPT